MRVPDEDQPRRRRQEVREYGTTTGSLLALPDCCSARESLWWRWRPPGYWKPVFYLLEAEGFTCWLLNARHVKNVPGRPKTDKLDAVWLAKVAERGMCWPSLVHPRPIRQLRDLTRYRRSLIRERTAEKQRVEKLLEDAQIKLSSVASDIFGVSGGRCSLRCWPGNPIRKSWPGWRTAGCAEDPPAAGGAHRPVHRPSRVPCQMMPDRIDDLTARIGEVTAGSKTRSHPTPARWSNWTRSPASG